MTTHRAPLPARLHPATALPYRPTHRRFLWRRVITRRVTGVLAVPALLVAGFAAMPVALPAAPVPYTGPSQTQVAPQAAVDAQAEVARLVGQYRCRYDGLPDGVTPVHAIVTGPDGGVEAVSFAVGWAMHLGQRPGELHAVCAT